MQSIMYKENYLEDNRITCPFADDRRDFNIDGYFYHEGTDYGNEHMSRLDVINLISGLPVAKSFHEVYGNFVKIRHNPMFVGGIDESFYSMYCHLKSYDDNIYMHKFLKYGDKIGIMGNTGNSRGVHLHLMCFQSNVKANKETELLYDIKSKLKIPSRLEHYFWQHNALYFNIDIIIKYFKHLQGA